jgi:tetratricopeptide (TPR) repeat protein
MPDDDPFALVCDRMRSGFEILTPGVTAADPPADTHAADAAECLSRVAATAHLAIHAARFAGRIQLDHGYAGYHYADIQVHPGASHGYAHLLAIANETTRGVAGYVSAEPLGSPGAGVPLQLFVLAMWVNDSRRVVDTAADLGDAARFLERAIPLANETFRVPLDPPQKPSGMAGSRRGGHDAELERLETAFLGGSIAAGVNLGARLAQLARYEEAETIWKAAIARGSADAAHNLGGMMIALRQLDRAEAAYRMALELGDPEAEYSLGTLFEAKGDWAQAARHYRNALEQQRDQRAPNNLAIVLFQLGREEEAERYLRLGRDMGDALAGENLRRLLRERGRPEDG